MAVHVSQIFVLSPARCDGRRAKLLLRAQAEFPLARAVHDEGAPLGEVFSFLSGLYFRGKLEYATAFARPPRDVPPVHIITTDRGLVAPSERVRRDDLLSFARVDLAAADDRFRVPLRRDADAIARGLSGQTRVILLGSIATAKYVDPLLAAFGERLVFPVDFVGRGDMSRGGLLLRSVRAERELEYGPVAGAIRRGKRPPKLDRVR